MNFIVWFFVFVFVFKQRHFYELEGLLWREFYVSGIRVKNNKNYRESLSVRFKYKMKKKEKEKELHKKQ